MTRSLIREFKINGVRIDPAAKKNMANPGKDSIQGYSVVDCSLAKELLKPNEFTFTLRRDNVEKTVDFKNYSIVKSLIGASVECHIDTTLTHDNQNYTSTLKFEGQISNVSVKGTSITCVAMSDDADLQGAPRCRFFVNKNLKAIVEEVAQGMNKTVNIHSYLSGVTFNYIVQYNESDYDFLVRLAKRFGAFLYYDYQHHLVFGQLPSNQVKDVLSPNSSGVNYEFQSSDSNFRYVAHYYLKDKDLDSTGADLTTLGNQELYKKPAEKSGKLVNGSLFRIDDPNSVPETLPQNVNLMDGYSKAMVSSNAGSLVTCKFISYLLDLEVGSIVKINNNGPLVVTSANISWDCDGSPSSEITAMLLPQTDNPLNVDKIYPPYMDFNTYPKSSAQRAVVIDNVDPLKMGRVKVRYVWQLKFEPNDLKDVPWIRIAQPYGGKEKGCFILPEIGEEVMVGFEHDNMEKPFVIGTLYHDSDQAAEKQMPDEAWVETANPVANKGNEVKVFRTKKGHTIEFHDVDGDQNYGYIRIYNKNKPADTSYEIVLSTDPYQVSNAQNNGKENYKTKSAKDDGIAAGKDIEEKDSYETSKLRLMVRSHGGDIVLDAGEGDIIMNAKNIRVHATGDATTLIDQRNIMKVKGDQFVDVKSNSLVVQEKQNIVVKGEDTEKYDAKVTIQADKDVEVKSKSEGSNFNLTINAKSLVSNTQEKTEIKASDFEAEAKKAAGIKANSGLELAGGSKANLTASKLIVEGKAEATMKGTNVSIEGTFNTSIKTENLTLDTTAGTRKGMWLDQ